MSEETSKAEPDWEELRELMTRRARFHLRAHPVGVEDVVQEGLLRLLRVHRRGDEVGNWEALATLVIARLSIDRLRSLKARAILEEELARVEESRSEEAESGEHRSPEALRRAILDLFRKAGSPCVELAKARLEGVDLRSIADNLGITDAAMRQRWSRCVGRIRDEFDGDAFLDAVELHTERGGRT